MTKFKVLALTATLIMATAGLAVACDKTASTASAQTAKAEMAQASGCSGAAKAETAKASGCTSAAAQTAQASGCASSAVKTAGAGCSGAAKAETAGAGCSSKATAETVRVETVRMPSGAMAVFYHGSTPESVAYLQAKAEAGCGGFVCNMAKSMAADEHVSTEMAPTETGVMILVTSSDKSAVDGYEAQYAALTTAEAQQGE